MKSGQGIFIPPIKFANDVLERNGAAGQAACEIMAAAIDAASPERSIEKNLILDGDLLNICDQGVRLGDFERIFLLGFGKAAVPMAKAVIERLGSDRISFARVITKDPKFLAENGFQDKLEVSVGGHPVPTEASVQATQSLLSSLPVFTPRDLVLLLISGGGSALFTDPVDGVTLGDLQEITRALLKSGADIHEINTVRKHLDRVKGGRFSQRLLPAVVHALILSDVIGDQLDMIASGPAVPDPTTFADAINIIHKYGIMDELPTSVFEYLESGVRGEQMETLKPGDLPPYKVFNHLVGTNFLSARAASHKADELGYHSVIITTHLTGHTQQVAEFIASIIETVRQYEEPVKPPACLIFGGETTVNVTGGGLGGRNMDLALHMVSKIAGKDGVLFISLATDGEDGPTDAVGAAVDSQMAQFAATELPNPLEWYIKDNDAYHFFESMGGLIKVGATGTNVNDLVLVIIE